MRCKLFIYVNSRFTELGSRERARGPDLKCWLYSSGRQPKVWAGGASCGVVEIGCHLTLLSSKIILSIHSTALAGCSQREKASYRLKELVRREKVGFRSWRREGASSLEAGGADSAGLFLSGTCSVFLVFGEVRMGDPGRY